MLRELGLVLALVAAPFSAQIANPLNAGGISPEESDAAAALESGENVTVDRESWVTLSPSEVVAGGTLRVEGVCRYLYQSAGRLKLGYEKLKSTQSTYWIDNYVFDPDGGFSVDVPIPLDAEPGTYELTWMCITDDVVFGYPEDSNPTFVVLPNPDAPSPSASVSTSVSVSPTVASPVPSTGQPLPSSVSPSAFAPSSSTASPSARPAGPSEGLAATGSASGSSGSLIPFAVVSIATGLALFTHRRRHANG